MKKDYIYITANIPSLKRGIDFKSIKMIGSMHPLDGDELDQIYAEALREQKKACYYDNDTKTIKKLRA